MARRKFNELKVRNTFFIITNGAQTEKNYFNLLKVKKSIYEVKVFFHNNDPLGLVEFAKAYVKDANQVWCVFDIDNSYKDGRLKAALKHAKNHHIKIAYSNIAFEVWLLSHFEQFRRPTEVKEYKRILDEELKKINSGIEYDKTNDRLIKKYFIPHYKQAMINAKIVYQTYIRDYKKARPDSTDYPIWNWNASTSVFQLVEALKLQL